ncbi:MAG: hypothetical protein ACI8XM_002403 [Haloarculaceae archaeon]|jgi:hypothetical protein
MRARVEVGIGVGVEVGVYVGYAVLSRSSGALSRDFGDSCVRRTARTGVHLSTLVGEDACESIRDVRAAMFTIWHRGRPAPTAGNIQYAGNGEYGCAKSIWYARRRSRLGAGRASLEQRFLLSAAELFDFVFALHGRRP